MKLPSTIRFFDDSIKEAFYKLEKGDNSEKELFKLMNQAIDNIEQNAFCGIQLPKRLIPEPYAKKNIKNIYIVFRFNILYVREEYHLLYGLPRRYKKIRL
jgi:hypothetical protein